MTDVEQRTCENPDCRKTTINWYVDNLVKRNKGGAYTAGLTVLCRDCHERLWARITRDAFDEQVK